MNVSYAVDANKFASWLVEYLKKLTANRELKPGSELGLSQLRNTGAYRAVAIKLPSGPEPIYFDELSTKDIPVNRSYTLAICYAVPGIYYEWVDMGKLIDLQIVSQGNGQMKVTLIQDNPKLEKFYQELQQAIDWHFPDSQLQEEEQETELTNTQLAGQDEQPSQPSAHATKRKRGNKRPTENDRIRTTLAMWAIKTNMCRSKAHAATSLGIDSDTITNHEKYGWLYSDEDMAQWGDYKSLWTEYTTTLRKT